MNFKVVMIKNIKLSIYHIFIALKNLKKHKMCDLVNYSLL